MCNYIGHDIEYLNMHIHVQLYAVCIDWLKIKDDDIILYIFIVMIQNRINKYLELWNY